MVDERKGSLGAQIVRKSQDVCVDHQRSSALLTDCRTEIDMGDRGDIQDVLTEGHKVANIVRHGDGDTSADLRQIAPRLWQSDLRAYVDINPSPSQDSALLIVNDDYLRDYTRADLRFWGRADRLPGAINDPPF